MKRLLAVVGLAFVGACLVSAREAPKRNASNRPVGTWEQKSDDGKIMLAITADHLRISAVGKDNKTKWMLDADYSVTKDSILYGIVNSIEEKHSSCAPTDPSRTLSPRWGPYDCLWCVDSVFSSRFRIDGDILTLKNLFARDAILQGRFKKKEDGEQHRAVAKARDKKDDKPASNKEPRAEKTKQVQWRLDYGKAIQEARAKNRPLVIALFAENDYFGMQLEKRTLDHPTIASLLNKRCIPVKIDAEQHSKLTEALKVQYFPTLVFANANGKILGYQQGFMEANALRERLANLFEKEHKVKRK